MRPWLERLGGDHSLERLNALAQEVDLRTESARRVRFVPPEGTDRYYELHLYETGRVQTRPDNLHDLFNALAWLSFPKTKARINALHAEEIPKERGRRGPRRDLITLLDEGGVIVQCNDAELVALARSFRWKTLFWERRAQVRRRMRLRIVGHATLEQALNPWPGIACKAIFVDSDTAADAAAHAWLAALPAEATPSSLAPLPVFGYPGWLPGSERTEFYDDTRYFRPFRERRDRAAPGRPVPPRDAAP